jgi:hypothetical protein
MKELKVISGVAENEEEFSYETEEFEEQCFVSNLSLLEFAYYNELKKAQARYQSVIDKVIKCKIENTRKIYLDKKKKLSIRLKLMIIESKCESKLQQIYAKHQQLKRWHYAERPKK